MNLAYEGVLASADNTYSYMLITHAVTFFNLNKKEYTQIYVLSEHRYHNVNPIIYPVKNYSSFDIMMARAVFCIDLPPFLSGQ